VQINKIIVDTLEPAWRRNVLAFELLGKAAKGLSDAPIEKLLDRRFASGHIDEQLLRRLGTAAVIEGDPVLSRKKQRVRYWASYFADYETQADIGIEQPSNWLASHPRIRTAIRRIEHWTMRAGLDGIKEKVLVFGTYTAPLRCLRDCLNARSLLRQIGNGLPARRGGLSLELIRYELQQMVEEGVAPSALAHLRMGELDVRLIEAAKSWERLRQNLAATITDDWVCDEMRISDRRADSISTVTEYAREHVIFDALAQGENPATSPEERKSRAKGVLKALIAAQSGYGEDREAEDIQSAESMLDRITALISSERSPEGDAGGHVSHASSTPAVYLGGGVSAVSQRLIQARFNEKNSNPTVLICQSVVGREGLNLHKACRVVLLFHPEWNPAVVEQQIGRVDRIGSRWEKLATAWRENGGEPEEFPRIVVEALCFSGTYDEYQTDQLNRRMAELKAQLFGEFASDIEVSDEVSEILREKGIDFSPRR